MIEMNDIFQQFWFIKRMFFFVKNFTLSFHFRVYLRVRKDTNKYYLKNSDALPEGPASVPGICYFYYYYFYYIVV